MMPGSMMPGSMMPGSMMPGSMMPGSMMPGSMMPGSMMPGSMMPGSMMPGSMMPGSMMPMPIVDAGIQPGTMNPAAMQPVYYIQQPQFQNTEIQMLATTAAYGCGNTSNWRQSVEDSEWGGQNGCERHGNLLVALLAFLISCWSFLWNIPGHFRTLSNCSSQRLSFILVSSGLKKFGFSGEDGSLEFASACWVLHELARFTTSMLFLLLSQSICLLQPILFSSSCLRSRVFIQQVSSTFHTTESICRKLSIVSKKSCGFY